MIIKIFKISTAEMWTLKNKERLIAFVERERDIVVPHTLSITQLIKYLPVENYYRVK